MDGYSYPEPVNAARHGRHRHQGIPHDTPGRARQPGARADLLRLRHYPLGTPGQHVAATRHTRQVTRAGVEEGCRIQAFGDADAAPRAPR